MAKLLVVTKYSAIALMSMLLAAFIFSSAVVFWILYHPASAWNFASRYFLPEDLKVTWESMEYNWRMNSWREWNYEWATKKLEITKVSPQMDVGVIEAEVQWSINLWTGKPFLEFKTFSLSTRENSFVQILPSSDSSPERSIYQMANDYLGYLSQTNHLSAIKVVNVSVSTFELRFLEGAPWVLQASIFKNYDTAEKEEIHFSAKAESDTLSIQGKGFINGDNFDTDQNFLGFDVEAKDTAWAVEGNWVGVFKEDRVVVKGKPNISVGEKNKTRIQPDLVLTLEENGLDLQSSMKVTGIPGPIVHLDRMKLQVHMPLEDDVLWADQPTTATLESPVDIFMIDKNMRPPLEKACKCKLPEEFMVRASAKAWMNVVFGEPQDRKKAAELAVSLDSVKNKLFSVDASASAEIFKQLQQWTFEPRVKADAMVHSFQGLRYFLDAKGVIIPAPLDILEGTLAIKADSPIARDAISSTANVSLDLDLKSATQAVLVSSDVQVRLANTFKALELDVDAIIKKLTLELPPLDPVLGIPAVTRDNRILKAPVEKSARPSFVVNIITHVATESAGAIRLLSKYAKPYVPVSVAVNTRNSNASGYVRLEPFKVSYLRRDLYVENFQLAVAQNADEELPLSGRFRIEQGGYKIFLTLKGTTESPSVAFTSEPVLSKDDIISVLLYGRVADQLVSAEAETAGNFNAAMTDRAIGLFGLWAFASTPIQSFSYNSTTKVYTATVDLGKGLTAGVGTNWEQSTNFELRKRLSRRWMLTAAWAPSSAQNIRQEGRIVLQWEKRYGLSAEDSLKQAEQIASPQQEPGTARTQKK